MMLLKKHFIIFLLLCAAMQMVAQVPNGAARQKFINEHSVPKDKLPEVNTATGSSSNGSGGYKKDYYAGTVMDSSGKKVLQVRGYQGSPDSSIRVAVLLPFDAELMVDRLYAFMKDKDAVKSEIAKLHESTKEALDFYEGLQFALNNGSAKQKLDLYLFDTGSGDSVIQDLLKSDTLKSCDIIIGPSTLSQAKLVAAFCKKNRIINVQPFVASKAIASENPYLVRFMPSIDAHLQKQYEMIMDSFDDKNIIVYTTKKERDLAAARQLDTLFKSYNAINTLKLKYTIVNTNDTTMPLAKRNIAAHLMPHDLNVVFIACYDEPLVNSQLRMLKEKEGKGKTQHYRDSVVIFGMPTWVDADQIRADYLSEAQPYVTDIFYADTLAPKVQDFIHHYANAYNQDPSRYSYMGYDAMSYLTRIFDKYGRAFTEGFNNESYEGLGYSFHISPMIRNPRGSITPVINYYSNTAMHLYQVRDYKVWKVR